MLSINLVGGGFERRMQRVERANKRLAAIASRTGMTEDGKNWLIAVLDPMHDEKLMCRGYPDRETGPSVVQTIKQSVPIKTPYSNHATWGFHVMLDDLMGQSVCRVRDVDQNMIETRSGDNSNLPAGGISIIANRGSEPVWEYPDSTSEATNQKIGVLQVPQNYVQGKSRILSQGFEIVNTTPELYKGGSLCVYESPSAKGDATTHCVINTTGGGKFRLEERRRLEKAGYEIEVILPEAPMELLDTTAAFSPRNNCGSSTRKWKPTGESTYIRAYKNVTGKSGNIVREYLQAPLEETNSVSYASVRWEPYPPDNLAEALLLSGAQQWDAAEGCYVVQTMNDMENPAGVPDYAVTGFSEMDIHPEIPDSIFAPHTDKGTAYFDPFPGFDKDWHINADTTSLLSQFHANKRIPFNRKGAIISGLAEQATFTLNFNTVIERFLSARDKDLVVLATPSPSEDPIAMQLYSEIVKCLPVGVRFKDNGLGDWFLGVVDEISNVVSSIGKPIMAVNEAYRQERGLNPASTYNQNPSTISQIAQHDRQKSWKAKPLPPTPKKKKALPPAPAKKPLPKVPTKP